MTLRAPLIGKSKIRRSKRANRSRHFRFGVHYSHGAREPTNAERKRKSKRSIAQHGDCLVGSSGANPITSLETTRPAAAGQPQKSPRIPTAVSSPFEFSGRIRSFKYAFGGISYLLRSQHNAWIHALATLLGPFRGSLFQSHGCRMVLDRVGHYRRLDRGSTEYRFRAPR